MVGNVYLGSNSRTGTTIFYNVHLAYYLSLNFFSRDTTLCYIHTLSNYTRVHNSYHLNVDFDNTGSIVSHTQPDTPHLFSSLSFSSLHLAQFPSIHLYKVDLHTNTNISFFSSFSHC